MRLHLATTEGGRQAMAELKEILESKPFARHYPEGVHTDPAQVTPWPHTRIKLCGDCKRYKPRTDYHSNKSTRDGLYPYCKPCRKERGRVYSKTRADQMHASALKRNYGLSRELYQAMLREQ